MTIGLQWGSKQAKVDERRALEDVEKWPREDRSRSQCAGPVSKRSPVPCLAAARLVSPQRCSASFLILPVLLGHYASVFSDLQTGTFPRLTSLFCPPPLLYSEADVVAPAVLTS